jgi:hypothetical protein
MNSAVILAWALMLIVIGTAVLGRVIKHKEKAAKKK